MCVCERQHLHVTMCAYICVFVCVWSAPCAAFNGYMLLNIIGTGLPLDMLHLTEEMPLEVTPANSTSYKVKLIKDWLIIILFVGRCQMII